MLFNSLAYCIFFPVVVTGFFLLPHRHRWVWLLGASYYFYGFLYPAFAALLFISTVVAFYCSLSIERSTRKGAKIAWLAVSLCTDLGMLFGFKYFTFAKHVFDSLIGTASVYDATVAKLLLPAGISFYTFQNLSYVFDVFRGRMPAQKSLGRYALFVSFFPQLVAGPIERAPALIPQLEREHWLVYGRVADGLKLILLGLFQKLLIADRLAVFVDSVYTLPASPLVSGLDALLATYFFAFQIYFDFGGYSLIAIGSAKVLGIELVDNFRSPYLAQNISEFWRSWHISLMSWLRDYIYFPLGGNRGTFLKWCTNIFIVFVVSGLWHGANWTFLAWGLVHAIYMILSRATARPREVIVRLLRLEKAPFLLKSLRIFLVFNAVCFGWIWFRAQNLKEAMLILKKIADVRTYNWGHLVFDRFDLRIILIILLFMAFIAFLQGRGSPRHFLSDRPVWFRWAIYFTMIVGIIIFRPGLHAFIYFQF